MIALALAVLLGFLGGSVATFAAILYLASRSTLGAPEPARPEPKEAKELAPSQEAEDRAFAEQVFDNIIAQQEEDLRQELYADAHEAGTALNGAFREAYQRAKEHGPRIAAYEHGWTALREKLREMDVDPLLALFAALREGYWKNDGDDEFHRQIFATVRTEMDVRVWQGTPEFS